MGVGEEGSAWPWLCDTYWYAALCVVTGPTSELQLRGAQYIQPGAVYSVYIILLVKMQHQQAKE